MIEEWDIQNTTVSLHKLLKTYPLILIDMLIDNINLLVLGSKANLFLEFANVAKYVHLRWVQSVNLIFKLCTHEISVDLEL